MIKIRLTAFFIMIIVLLVGVVSCDRDDVEQENTFTKDNIVMSGAQETPSNPSAGVGKLNVTYSRLAKTLFYNFSWSGLTGPVTAAHIHGLAPLGFSTGVFQTFTLSSIVPCKVNGINGPTSCGSYSGTLFIDGVAIKEDDLLNGQYYVNLHTATYPGGEIRGQITFE